MTPDDAARAVRRIKTAASDGDGALAHSMEDNLYRDALTWISQNGDAKSARLAAVAIEAIEVTFERWYG